MISASKVVHRQIVLQVQIVTYGGDKRAFEVTKTFVKRNRWAQYFVEDLMAEIRNFTYMLPLRKSNGYTFYTLPSNACYNNYKNIIARWRVCIIHLIKQNYILHRT